MVARAFVIGNAAWDETLHLAALPAPGASVHVRRGAAGPGGKGREPGGRSGAGRACR